MATVKSVLKEDLRKLQDEYDSLDAEWERIDSQGLSEKQRQIATRMLAIEEKIKTIKFLLDD